MKTIGVIPARYGSTRFPGKPLALLCGKPMLLWVYEAVLDSKVFDMVVCAIDDKRVEQLCKKYEMNYCMTSSDHPNHIARIHEVSEVIEADYYVCINGDEPLISKESIVSVIQKERHNTPFFCGAMRKLSDPAETIDFANIKIVFSEQTGKCLYMSRTPVPYPRGTLLFSYWKYVGVECFNKAALDFFVNTPQNDLETIEDIDHLRFLVNGIELHFSKVDTDSISVDTLKDVEKVEDLIKKRI